MEPAPAPMFVGIDVSKDRLDVHIRPAGTRFVVGRDGAGLEQLASQPAALGPTLVVLEATGGFEIAVAAARACRWPWSTRARSAPSPGRSAGWPRPTGSTPR